MELQVAGETATAPCKEALQALVGREAGGQRMAVPDQEAPENARDYGAAQVPVELGVQRHQPLASRNRRGVIAPRRKGPRRRSTACRGLRMRGASFALLGCS